MLMLISAFQINRAHLMALPKLKTQGLGTGSIINPNAKVVSFHKKADCLIYWAIKQSCFIQDSYLSEDFIYKFFDDDDQDPAQRASIV